MIDTNVYSPSDNCYIKYPMWCQHRLPCGYCKELGRMCPLEAQTITYTNTTNYTSEVKANE